MKIILTGTTGFIGTHTLLTCLSHPSITTITTLTRRPLPSSLTSHPNAARLHSIILEDFLVYPASIIEQLHGATACIWCLGGLSGDRTIDLGYTMAGARKFATEIKLPEGQSFRFVYTSGAMAERDQSARLWVMGRTRKLRGEVENELLKLAEGNKGFEVVIAKPGLVERRENVLPRGLDAYTKSIRVDELAGALVEAAVEGCGRDTLDNAELRARGARVLERVRMAKS